MHERKIFNLILLSVFEDIFFFSFLKIWLGFMNWAVEPFQQLHEIINVDLMQNLL